MNEPMTKIAETKDVIIVLQELIATTRQLTFVTDSGESAHLHKVDDMALASLWQRLEDLNEAMPYCPDCQMRVKPCNYTRPKFCQNYQDSKP